MGLILCTMLNRRVVTNMKESNYQKISAVSKVTTGPTNSLFSRDFIEGAEEYHMLNGASIDSMSNISKEALTPVWEKKGKDLTRFKLQVGDVVLLNKGIFPKIAFISEEILDIPLIASANFLVIRADPDKLLGEVLVSYINSSLGKEKLKNIQTGGTLIQSIPASAFRNFEIPILPLEIQVKVVELHKAGLNAYNTTLALAEQQKNMIEAKIINMLEGAS